jgi:2-dehydro-3-deoxygalactonokinase
MANPAYVAVDWGTSSFRLWLIGADGSILGESRSDEGMTTAARTGFPAVLATHLAKVGAPDTAPVIVCGMAGAKQGWVEAGYIDVPTSLSAILTGAVAVQAKAATFASSRASPSATRQSPDVMRGEETQLLGALGPTARDRRPSACRARIRNGCTSPTATSQAFQAS